MAGVLLKFHKKGTWTLKLPAKKENTPPIYGNHMVQRCQPPPPPPTNGHGSDKYPPPPCGCGPVVGLWWFRVGLELV